MKKFMGVLLLFFLSITQSYASERQYQEGEAYFVVEGAAAQPGQLQEYFSLLCPHCFAFEPYLTEVKKQLGAEIHFERIHVDFLRGVDKAVQRALTKGYVVALDKGVESEYVSRFFARIHIESKRPQTEQDVVNFLSEITMSGEAVRGAIKSPETLSAATVMAEKQNALVGAGMLKGVPTLVVGGRYVVNLGSLDRADPVADLSALLEFLNNKVDK